MVIFRNSCIFPLGPYDIPSVDLQLFLTYCSINSSVSLNKPTQAHTYFFSSYKPSEQKFGDEKRKMEARIRYIGHWWFRAAVGWHAHAGIVTRLLISVIYTVQ